MKNLALFSMLLFSAFVYSQDSISLPISKVKNLVSAAEKGKISEQQVQSFINMDSLYMDLSRQFQTTVMAQQESMRNLIQTNSLGVKVIEKGFSDIRSDFKNLGETIILKNLWLEDKNKELEKKVSTKNKTIIILSTVLASGVAALIAF